MDKKIEELENELKVLKNEIKATLTDIREHLLTNVENPFPIEMAREAPRKPVEKPAETPTATPIDYQALIAALKQPAAAAAPGLVAPAPGGNGGGQVIVAAPPFAAAPPAAASPATVPGPATQVPQPYDFLERITMPKPKEAPDQELVAEIEPAATEITEIGDGASDIVMEAEATVNNGHRSNGSGKHAAKELGKLDRVDAVDRADKANRAERIDRVEDKATPQSKPEAAGTLQEEPIDLVTVAMLTSWIEDGVYRVGRKRLKGIVEIYDSMGGLPPNLKGVLLQLIDLNGGSYISGGKVPIKECLRVLAALDNLVVRGRFDRSGAAVLAMLLNGRSPSQEDQA